MSLLAAPRYLLDARDWDRKSPAKVTVRIEFGAAEPVGYDGSVAVRRGKPLELYARASARDRTPEQRGIVVEQFAFKVTRAHPSYVVILTAEVTPQTEVAVTVAGATRAVTVAQLLTDDCSFQLPNDRWLKVYLTFVYPPDDLPRIAQLKKLYPRTEIVTGAEARAVLCAPAGRHEDAARKLIATIRTRCGAQLTTVPDTALIDPHLFPVGDVLKAQNVIALGNANDNRLIGALWGRGYAYASALYPGPGGYVIRTVHDPFALGHNVLILGGTDAPGVRKAVDLFLHKFASKGGNLVLNEPVVDVQYHPVKYPSVPDEWPKRMPQFRTKEYWRPYCADRKLMDQQGTVLRRAGKPAEVVGAVFACMALLADTYFYLGSPELPPLVHELLARNLDSFRQFQPVPTREMEAGITSFATTWDLIEEWPQFTDEERLLVTNVLLACARLGHEKRAMHTLVREGCRQIMDENHGTNSALNSFAPWQYFHKYYDLPESKYWIEMCDALFRGQAASFQIPEDACGYLQYCPYHAMRYACWRPMTEYFERGVAAEHADYVLACAVNNLGLSSGYGDTNGIVPVSSFPLLATALWYYRDGRYRWALEHLLHRNCGLRVYSNRYAIRDDVAPLQPTDLLGIRVQPIYLRPVIKGDGRLEPVYAGREIPDPKLFNKISFREGWAPDQQFLVLSGMARSGHTHRDANCIVNFTDNGRMWLVDHDYGLRRAADHSGVVACRNGESAQPGRMAELVLAADLPTVGFSRTRSGPFRGLIWDRDIIWLKGRWFAVLDALAAREKGQYFARCSWRALGQEALGLDALTLVQDGQQMTIATDGQAELNLQTHAYASDEEWRSFYKHAEPVVKVLRQDRLESLQEGDTIGFASVLCAQPTAEAKPLKVVRLGTRSVVLWVGAEPYLLASGPLEVGTLKVDAKLALLTRTSMALAAPQAIAIGDTPLLQCPEPLSLEVNLAHGTAQIGRLTTPHSAAAKKADTTGALTWCGRPLRLTESPARLPGAFPADAWAAAWRSILARAPARPRTAAEHKPTRLDHFALGRAARLPAPLVALAPWSDGGVVAGLNSGAVVVVSRAGRPGWSRNLPDKVTALASADLDRDGKPEALVGCADHFVYALDDDGKQLWRFEVEPGGRSAGPQQARIILPADLDADGTPEILVAAPKLYCLNADGTRRWANLFAFWRNADLGDCRAVSAGDLDGDGKADVVASFYSAYPGMRALDRHGKALTPAILNVGTSGIHVGAPHCNLALDFQGRGRGLMLQGDTAGVLSAPYDTKARFADSVFSCSTPTHLLKLPRKNQPPLVIVPTDTWDIWALQHREGDAPARLHPAWRENVREPITAAAVADLTGDGTGEVLIGTKRGNVRLLSAQGRWLAAALTWGAPVRSLVWTGDAVAVGQADGTVRWLQYEP